MSRAKRILLWFFIAVPAALLVHAQSKSRPEIQVTTHPFLPEQSSLRVQTNLVEVTAVVRDKDGHAITGLNKQDFDLRDNGKSQPISAFSEEHRSANASAPASADTASPDATAAARPNPRFIALFFDDINMKPPDMVNVRRAARRYIFEGLGKGDMAAVFTSSGFARLDFTEDRQKILDTIENLSPHQRRVTEVNACPPIGPLFAYLLDQFRGEHNQELDLGIAEATACGACMNARGPVDPACPHTVQAAADNVLSMAEAIAEQTLDRLRDAIAHLSSHRGTRVLLLSSSGFFTQSIGDRQYKVIEEAVRDGVVINALDARGLTVDALGGSPDDGEPVVLMAVGAVRPDLQAYADTLRTQERAALSDPLSALAASTGGSFFHNSNDLTKGFRQLGEAPEDSYLLGFAPENLVADGKFHKLELKLTDGRKAGIQARPGYYDPKKEKNGELSDVEKQALFRKEAAGSDELSQIPMHVTAQPAVSDSTADFAANRKPRNLNVNLHFDMSKVPFRKESGRRDDRVIVVSELFDTRGNFLQGQELIMDLSLRDATLAKITQEGLDAHASLAAPPGTYRLRVVVQEEAVGQTTATDQPIEIH